MTAPPAPPGPPRPRAATVCVSGGLPIVGEPRWVDVDGGPPVPMCFAHGQAAECGRELVDLFNYHPDVVAALDVPGTTPCPAAHADVDTDVDWLEFDDDGRALLDKWDPSGPTIPPPIAED